MAIAAIAACLSSGGTITGTFFDSYLALALLGLTHGIAWVVLACVCFRNLSIVFDAPFLLTPIVSFAGMNFAATDIPFRMRLDASEPELREFAEQCLGGRKDCPPRVGYMPVEKLYDQDVSARVVTIITSEGYSQVRGVTYAPDGLPERHQRSGRPAYTHLSGPWYRFYIRHQNQ